MEQVFCLKRLAEMSPGATMVSYRALFYQDPHLMRSVVARLGADAAKFGQDQFEAELFQRRQQPEPPSDDFYQEFFARFRFDLIDSYFAANPLSQSDDRAFLEVVSEQFAQLPQPGRFAEFVQQMGGAAAAYPRTWSRHCRKRIDNPNEAACHWLQDFADRVVKRIFPRVKKKRGARKLIARAPQKKPAKKVLDRPAGGNDEVLDPLAWRR
jgi:hypothetical protein